MSIVNSKQFLVRFAGYEEGAPPSTEKSEVRRGIGHNFSSFCFSGRVGETRFRESPRSCSICGNPSVALPTAILARSPAVRRGIERQGTESVSLHLSSNIFSIVPFTGCIALKEGSICVAFSDISGVKKPPPVWCLPA